MQPRRSYGEIRPRDEPQRHVRENMTGEELVSFVTLTRPAPELSPVERATSGTTLKQLLVINWRQKSTARPI